MSSFITYDSATGDVIATYRIGNQDIATAMAANVQSGQSALEVADDAAVMGLPSRYKVVSGAVVLR